jgi:ribokinase
MWVWGESVGLVAGVGEDYPKEWIDRIASADIDLSGVYKVPEVHALRSRVFYRPDGSRTDRLADVKLSPEAEAAFDLTSDFSAMDSAEHNRAWPLYSPKSFRVPQQFGSAIGFHLAPGPHENLQGLAGDLRRSNPAVLITLDWPWWNESKTELDLELLNCVSAVLPGAEELERMPIAGSAAATITALASNCNVVVVKRGASGSEVYWDGRRITVGISKVEAVDPTGAGDAFCGGFLVGLARTGDPGVAAMYGAVSASLIVESFGALAVLQIDKREPQGRLKSLMKTTEGE